MMFKVGEMRLVPSQEIVGYGALGRFKNHGNTLGFSAQVRISNQKLFPNYNEV